MEPHQFVDRFFLSQSKLLDQTMADERDSNTLYTFLNCLHTAGDRLKEDFACDIRKHPEFKLLRIIRNYFHHVGDVESVQLKVCIKPGVAASHSEHLIIPLETFARSVRSFIEKNTLPPDNKTAAKKRAFVDAELASISEIYDYTADLLANLELFCNKRSLKLDGVVHELGCDIFKFVFNITNIVADECRAINELSQKTVITQIDRSFTATNNMKKRDLICLPNLVPITTTKGFAYFKTVELAT